MPKPKRIIRRNKTKRVIHKDRPMKILNEDDIKNIPPHMLDKLPSGLSVRPNNETMSRLLLQRMAPQYQPMPLTPQQQQLNTLRTNNDVKEQAINQQKQQEIHELERKLQLYRDEHNLKQQVQTMQHENQMTKLELDQSVKQQEMLNKAKQDEYKLTIQKKELDQENEVNKTINEANDLKMQITYLEHQINTTKNLHEYDQRKKEVNQLYKRYNDLLAEYNAVKETIAYMDSTTMQKRLTELTNDIGKIELESQILHEIKERKRNALIERMKNQTYSPQQANQVLNAHIGELKAAEVELAKQLKVTEDKETNMKRQKYITNKIEDIWQQQQNEQLKQLSLDKKLEDAKQMKDLKEHVKNATKLEIENAYKLKEIDEHNALQQQLQANKLAEYKQSLLQSPEVQQLQKNIAINERKKILGQEYLKLTEETIDTYYNAQKELYRKEAALTVTDAYRNGRDAINDLNARITPQTTSFEATQVYKAIGDEAALQTQKNHSLQKQVDRFLANYSADTPLGEAFRQWCNEHGVDISSASETEFKQMFNEAQNDIGAKF